MKTFKGTKGEWHTYNNKGVSTNRFAICELVSYSSGEMLEQSEANLKLIAAAPEILKALEIIASNSNDHAMIRVAMKAINKALGE